MVAVSEAADSDIKFKFEKIYHHAFNDILLDECDSSTKVG